MSDQSKPRYITTNKWILEQNHLKGKTSKEGKGHTIEYDYLYGRLNIIDGKVSSLLSVNAIFLAVAGVLALKLPESVDCFNMCLLKASVITWLLSTALCLSVSFLKWEYLNDDASNYQTYMDKIISVTVARTHFYNAAVILIVVSGILFTVVSFQHFW